MFWSFLKFIKVLFFIFYKAILSVVYTYGIDSRICQQSNYTYLDRIADVDKLTWKNNLHFQFSEKKNVKI